MRKFRYNSAMKVLTPEKMHMIRSAFFEADYTREGILKRIGAGDFPSLKGSDIPILLHRTQGGSALDTLIRLFLVEVPCALQAVDEAVAPLGVSDWVEAGLLTTEDSLVLPAVKILPHGETLLAFDLPSMLGTAAGRDYVMGIGASSLTLANLTIRRPSGLTLDLGTGCGMQALMSCRHSDKVIATDINERAIAFARFNAALNGIQNVEFLLGDSFGPAAGRLFDLIVSNPPYVISPEHEYTYCNSTLTGDAMCRKIVQEAPALLAEGGFCQVLCNWAEFEGRPWMEHIRAWVDLGGCDAWVIRSKSSDITSYASTWIRHTHTHMQGMKKERFDSWMRYYDHMGITRVGAGIVTLRKRKSAHNWFRADEAPDRMLGPCGDSIALGFALTDFLESVSDSDLLSTRLALSGDARLERVCRPDKGGWKDTDLKLSLERGLAYTGSIDGVMANFLIECTGSTTLDEIISYTARRLGSPVDPLLSPLVDMVRSLIKKGFLLPVHGPAR